MAKGEVLAKRVQVSYETRSETGIAWDGVRRLLGLEKSTADDVATARKVEL